MNCTNTDRAIPEPVSEPQERDGRRLEVPEDVEYQGGFVAAAIRCRDLGWRLAAVDARELIDLAVNFSEPVDLWLRQCSRAGPLQGRVNLGVHTGSVSGLLVLEVKSGEGNGALDRCGSWRSPCRARLNGREQHFYGLAAGGISPPTRFLPGVQLMVYGEEGLAPLPPSMDVQTRECWRWLNPPWENPPAPAPPALLEFLQQPHPTRGEADYAEIPPWEDIYRQITPHEALLKALLAPCRSLEDYYGNLLREALDAGFHDRGFLLGLLRRAPQGDVERNPGRLAHLRRLVNEARSAPAGDSPGFTPPVPEPQGSENIVPLSRSRYEVILADLRMLRQKAAELEALLLNRSPNLADGLPQPAVSGEITPPSSENQAGASLEDCRRVENLLGFLHDQPFEGNPEPAPPGDEGHQAIDQDAVRFHYTELSPTAAPDCSEETLMTMVSRCLQNNPDLAQDPAKLQMVQYCFKNYVNINPDLSDLSLMERLERASQMAREFLGTQA
jgi:hypothetical protein